jgi:hypothetical protein
MLLYEPDVLPPEFYTASAGSEAALEELRKRPTFSAASSSSYTNIY